MLHVEILRNEWSAGRQRVVARLVINGTGTVVYDGAEEWAGVVPESFRDPESGNQIGRQDGVQYLTALHHHLNGDYVFATEAHESGQCEFALGTEIPLAPSAGVTPTPDPAAGHAAGHTAQPA
jgi:hypothetical protein